MIDLVSGFTVYRVLPSFRKRSLRWWPMVGGYRVLPSFFRVHSRLWGLMAGDYSFRFRHGSKGRFGVGLRWNEDVWGNSVKNPVRVASADWSTRYRRAGPLRGTGSAFRFAYRRRNDQSRPFPPSFFFHPFSCPAPLHPTTTTELGRRKWAAGDSMGSVDGQSIDKGRDFLWSTSASGRRVASLIDGRSPDKLGRRGQRVGWVRLG